MTLSALFSSWSVAVKDCPAGFALAQLLDSAQGFFQEEAVWTSEAWEEADPDLSVYTSGFDDPVALVLEVGSSSAEDEGPGYLLTPTMAKPTDTGVEVIFDTEPLTTGYLYLKVAHAPLSLTADLPFSALSPEILALKERFHRDLYLMGGRPWSDQQEAARRDELYGRRMQAVRAGKMKGGVHSRTATYTHPEELP